MRSLSASISGTSSSARLAPLRLGRQPRLRRRRRSALPSSRSGAHSQPSPGLPHGRSRGLTGRLDLRRARSALGLAVRAGVVTLAAPSRRFAGAFAGDGDFDRGDRSPRVGLRPCRPPTAARTCSAGSMPAARRPPMASGIARATSSTRLVDERRQPADRRRDCRPICGPGFGPPARALRQTRRRFRRSSRRQVLVGSPCRSAPSAR